MGWFKDSTVEDILWAASVLEFGPQAWQKAYATFPTLRHMLGLSRDRIQQAGFSDKQAYAITQDPKNMLNMVRLLEKHSIYYVTLEDPQYPAILKEISDPPLWLFARGSLEAITQPSLTIVGTRKPTAYAVEALQQVFDSELRQKVTVVSGLAFGIDKLAHQLALQGKRPTVAVLAGGLDETTPHTHYQLGESIIHNGGVLLSEYPPLSPPNQPWRFPVRNRILAGLSSATLVVEAMIKSGSMTTAKSALEYNREVWAIPGDITRLSSEGANLLLKQGATPIISAEQLKEYFQLTDNEHLVDSPLGKVLHLLTQRDYSVDELATGLEEPIDQVLGYLTQLELSGKVAQSGLGQFKLIQK